MVLDSNVDHSCPVVLPTNVRLAVLAVTLAEGWLWAWPVVAASDKARLRASIPPIILLVFVCIMFPFGWNRCCFLDRAEPVPAFGFVNFSTPVFPHFPPA